MSNNNELHRDLYEHVRRIIQSYDQPEIRLSKAFLDGGPGPIWQRFERAAINQIEEGKATISRYAIWANTVRDNIVEAVRLIDTGDKECARDHLIRAVNGLSAFSEFQAVLLRQAR